MKTIPDLKTEGLHPDHADILEHSLAHARALLAEAQQGPLDSPDPLVDGADRRPTKEAAGNGSSEGQRAGSPWEADVVTSWVSPNLKRGKK
ncbi:MULTISPECIES: hypothetical protein [Mycobacteroides]|uniref:Uncharacterized protein n=1 Tax=Mycobacteroides immunogenum TaxID=83262 RepID=A0A7V8RWI3_9MYCO|nr:MULTISPECIES: hypothetical protein [Mycobacteroides]AMT69256.1 hypothetical protein ABG82_01645 [Mycobacteroides immunogenum]ANO02287.1 hypothetical protein BAB75_01645 [Mycobacteroides immunogenum]KIU38257.1 hypothetical protein TL11_23345 [Mycobacteroides immunogenum]KPG11227.1 hypothetical protein AN908_12630 [Mycobacteroides immunogenum]KPG12554.1 hypothetical protein AN909_07030 [Mycobacteroides immunogenum]